MSDKQTDQPDMPPGPPGEAGTVGIDQAAPETGRGRPDAAKQGRVKLTGVLLEHGKAKFNFDQDEKVNYYVKYRDNKGVEQITWGVGLELAMKESKADIGQRVELKNLGPEPVVVIANVRDGTGKVIGQQEIETHRNKWEVKASVPRAKNPKEVVKHDAVAVAKPSRQPAADDKASTVEVAEEKPVTKPPRAPRKPAAKATIEPANGRSASRATSVSEIDIPPLTDEAVSFLAMKDSTPADLLKLGPESLAFVRHHHNFMQRVEESSQMRNAYLMANARPVSPAYQKFVDALILRRRQKPGPGKEAAAAVESAPDKLDGLGNTSEFYGPKTAAIAAYVLTPVKLGNLTTGSEKLATQEVENSVEPSNLRQASAEHKPAQEMSATQSVAAATVTAGRPKTGHGLLFAIGSAAQKAGMWLADRGKQGQASTLATGISMGQATSANKPVLPAAQVGDKSTVVPREVARRYLKVNHEYYFPDRTPAFSDRGNKLATRGANPEVVRSLVEIARARGWDDITVKGTEEFRRSAWMEAAQIGLKVVGYQPTQLDLAELAKRPATNSVEKGSVKEVNAPKLQQGTRSADQGRYAAAAVPATAKGLPITPPTKPDPELAKKAKAFEENKPTLVVKKYPDLVGAYGIVEAAKAFASEKLPESAREEFVGMARRHVMQKIITGDTVKGPQIYLAAAKVREDQNTKTVDGMGEPHKQPEAKEISRER